MLIDVYHVRLHRISGICECDNLPTCVETILQNKDTATAPESGKTVALWYNFRSNQPSWLLGFLAKTGHMAQYPLQGMWYG